MIKTYNDIQEAFLGLLSGLLKRRDFPRTIVYCQRLLNVDMYTDCLGIPLEKAFTEPEGAPDLP